MDETPIIRFELQHMKHTLLVALSEYQAQLDADIKAAVDTFCQPHHLRAIIRDQVSRVLEHVIREEVKKFFQCGPGRRTVAEAVKMKLLAETSFDEVEPQ